MNKELLALLNQPFLCSKESLQALTQMVMSENEIKANVGMSVNSTDDNEATIHIHGIMFRYENMLTEWGYGISTEKVSKQIKNALQANKHVNLVIDSGGGVVNGMSEFTKLISDNKDNITAYAKGLCCSAAFWAGTSAGKFFVEDTTVVGSLGVVTTAIDTSKYYEDMGIVLKEVTSSNAPNKRIDITTEEGMKALKGELDDFEDIFISKVAENRNIGRDELIKACENGGTISGKLAVERGVADGIYTQNQKINKEMSMPKMEKTITQEDSKNVEVQANLEAEKAKLEQERLAIQQEKANLQLAKERQTTFKAFANELSVEDMKALDEKNASAAEVSTFVLNKRADTMPQVNVTVGDDLSALSATRDIENALVLGMGAKVADASNRSMKLGNGSIKGIIGEHSGLGYANSDQEFMAAMTTSDFPILLKNAVNRVLIDKFEEQATTFDALVERVAHRDFKVQQSVQRQHIPPTVFKEIVEGGELKAFTVKEYGESSAIGTYGAKYNLTRQMLINDDLNAFSDLFKGFGYAAKRLINSLVYQLIEGRGAFANYKLSDGKPFFHADRHNIATVAGAIKKDAISSMRTALGRQTDDFGEPKAIMPEFILTPFELQTDAEVFLNSTSTVDTNNSAMVNPFHKKFNVISDAYLEDAKAWYLGAKGAVKLGYLQQTNGLPQIEITNQNRVEGIEYSCLLDFKVYPGDPKRIIKNVGV